MQWPYFAFSKKALDNTWAIEEEGSRLFQFLPRIKIETTTEESVNCWRQRRDKTKRWWLCRRWTIQNIRSSIDRFWFFCHTVWKSLKNVSFLNIPSEFYRPKKRGKIGSTLMLLGHNSSLRSQCDFLCDFQTMCSIFCRVQNNGCFGGFVNEAIFEGFWKIKEEQ